MWFCALSLLLVPFTIFRSVEFSCAIICTIWFDDLSSLKMVNDRTKRTVRSIPSSQRSKISTQSPWLCLMMTLATKRIATTPFQSKHPVALSLRYYFVKVIVAPEVHARLQNPTKMRWHAGHAALRQLHPPTTKCREYPTVQILSKAFVACEPDISSLSGLLSATVQLLSLAWRELWSMITPDRRSNRSFWCHVVVFDCWKRFLRTVPILFLFFQETRRCQGLHHPHHYHPLAPSSATTMLLLRSTSSGGTPTKVLAETVWRAAAVAHRTRCWNYCNPDWSSLWMITNNNNNNPRKSHVGYWIVKIPSTTSSLTIMVSKAPRE
jgi:hypothetical protein